MQILDKTKQRLEKILSEYQKIIEILNYEEIILDKKLFLKYDKQKQLIEPIAKKYQVFQNLTNDLIEYKSVKDKSNDVEKCLYQNEIDSISQSISQLAFDLETMVQNFGAKIEQIIVEIVNENKNIKNQLIVDLIDGYRNFCNLNNFDCTIDNIKNTTKLYISGLNSKQVFENEIGLHVSKNAKEDYVCQIFVYLKPNFEEFCVDENNTTVTSTRSSGAGGQHINTTDSAIKVFHKPTGISAICQSERSQFQNKQRAIENLKQKVEEFYNKQQEQFINKQKQEQLRVANHKETKIYDYKSGQIIKFNKQTLLISDFVSGKSL